MKKLFEKLRKIFFLAKTLPRQIVAQYRGVIDTVAERALRRREKTIMSVDPKQVQSVAMTLEATLAMSEHLSPEEMLTVHFMNEELTSFVCYMRQLDSEYRQLVGIILKKEDGKELLARLREQSEQEDKS